MIAAFAMPVTSSMLKHTTPFALPGRWRTMTLPTIRTRLPERMRANLAAEVTPSLMSGQR